MKQKNKLKKVIYYDNELNNEFSTAQITPKTIGDDYVYVRDSVFEKFIHFFGIE